MANHIFQKYRTDNWSDGATTNGEVIFTATHKCLVLVQTGNPEHVSGGTAQYKEAGQTIIATGFGNFGLSATFHVLEME